MPERRYRIVEEGGQVHIEMLGKTLFGGEKWNVLRDYDASGSSYPMNFHTIEHARKAIAMYKADDVAADQPRRIVEEW